MAKILYHHRTVSRDGQRVHIDEMVNAWTALGHDIVMVEPSGSGQGKMGADSSAVEMLKANIPGQLYELAELVYSVPAFFKLLWAYWKHKPDFLYERYTSFMLAGQWLKKLTGIVFCSEVNAPLSDERQEHGNLKLVGLARLCDRLIWRTADRIFPVTHVLAGYVTRAGIDDAKLDVIPNGINTLRFASAPSEKGAKADLDLTGKTVLGFVGFVRVWHGLDRVLPLLKADPNAYLLIVGDGPARSPLEAAAQAAGIIDQLRFTGFVERDDIARHVMAFDIALQPDVVAYASPLKLFEYLALGRAIIAPDMPNIREVIEDGENCLLFDPADANAFVQSTQTLMEDAKLRAKLGKAARALVTEAGYTWESNAKRVLAHAEAIAATRS